ncbi:MAG: hypothetical protein WC247_01925 [Porticoccaceae bacterium]
MDREHFLVALFPLSRLVPQSVAGLAARRFAATADICQQPCTLFPAAMIFATATDIDTGSRALAPRQCPSQYNPHSILEYWR